MTEQDNYWQELFKEYKKSGLKRLEFCKLNGLTHTQFRYQWNKQRQKTQHVVKVMNPALTESLFEPVVITKIGDPAPANRIVDLAIHLPNKIRCDLKIDLNSPDFPFLLQQLVVVC